MSSAETGLTLPLTTLPVATSDAVAIYAAEAPPSATVVLDDEHDAFAWLGLDEAMERCLPPEVDASIQHAAGWLDDQR